MTSRGPTQTTVVPPAHDEPQAAPTPGLVLLFSGVEPFYATLPCENGVLELGRGVVGHVRIDDGCMSRRHARVAFGGDHWTVEDLDSRNGTALDGAPLQGSVRVPTGAPRVLRTGDTVFLLVSDTRPFAALRMHPGAPVVMGPALAAVWRSIEHAAPGRVLHLTGESGTGKELAARAFHQAGPASAGPFVAVNSAAIPAGVAERLLFGTRKGAFSGAHVDADGYFQEANRGTLFLDEIGELDLDVQAKLLRVLETGEVFPLGASRPVRVDVCLCTATREDLLGRVTAGRFREDLYYRIGRPALAIPPLRNRREEIPLLVTRAVHEVAPTLSPHVSLVESCMLRHWSGNVRELLVEARMAARAALAAERSTVRGNDLSEQAGRALTAGAPAPEPAPAASPEEQAPMPSRERIEEALRRCEGRVASAARELGLHRNRLRRWLEKHGVDPRQWSTDSGDE